MQRLLCALLILTNAISPFAYGAEAATAAPAVVVKESAETCENLVKTEAKYKPIGYVTGAVVNQLTKTTPLLFTELYFRSLGIALSKAGFKQMVNSKGIFQEKISESDKVRVLDIIAGKTDASVQVQGQIASEMWNQMVAALQLEKVLDPRNITLDAKKAYFTSNDDFIGVHDYMLANMAHKREVIELMRLSLPYGVRMAADGLGGSAAKAIFVTSAVTVVSGVVTYALAQLSAMLGMPAPHGILPILLPVVVAPTAGVATYIYTAPKSQFQKLQIRIMNWSNRRSLQKQGLISKDDGESTGFIKAAFRDLGDLQHQVDVNDIKAVYPVPPTSTKLTDVESAMMKYGDKLSQQMNIVSAFQEMIATEMQKHARQMGQPINTLARLLQLKGEATAYAVPDNARVAIQDYADQVMKAYDMLAEAQGEYEALLTQYDIHTQVLTSYLDQSQSGLDVRSKVLIEQKLHDMEATKVAIQTLLNVVNAQKQGLETDKRALDSALSTIAIVAGNNALTAAQADSLNKALWNLNKTVDAAHDADIKDNETIPTTEAGRAQ